MASDNENVSSEPDFSEFADWHVTEQEEEWPPFDEFEMDLSAAQKKIVADNVALLENRSDWSAKVIRFSRLIESISNDEERAKILKQFQIRFDKYEFNNADIKDYTFPCATSFSGAFFKDITANFHRAVFKESVSFSGAKFINTPAYFFGMTVQNGDFYFNHVHVENRVINFFKARFLGDIAEFNSMVLRKTIFSANEIKVKGHLFITNNNFPNSVNFRRLSVGGACDLSKNTFYKVPDFTSSIFDRPPDVSGMEILAFKKWKVWKFWVCPFWNVKSNEGAKFRKLKAMALAANDHEKDGEFFAYEMLAKRGHESGSKGPVALSLNWLYFIFSRYGQSYKRPFSFLIFSLLGGWVGYGLWIGVSLANADRWCFAFEYSLRNFVPLSGSFFRFAPTPNDHESWFDKTFHELAHSGFNVDWLTYVGIFQNFIGLILLFLLLLGLRNKFRLK